MFLYIRGRVGETDTQILIEDIPHYQFDLRAFVQ